MVVLLELLLLAGLVPIYLSNRLINHQENYVFELIVSTESELINSDIESLVDLSTSLKYNSSSNGTGIGKHAGDDRSPKFDIVSDLNSDLTANENKRKRNGELDMAGYNRRGVLLYLNILVYLLLVLALFLAKKGQVDAIKASMRDQFQVKEWRNGRLLLQVNLKKWLFEYELAETINGTSLESWIRESIMRRKTSYVLSDILSNIETNCSNYAVCNPNSNLATEISLNMYGETLMAEAFIDKAIDFKTTPPATTISKSISKIALAERIEEICSQIVESRKVASSDWLFEQISVFMALKSAMLSVAVVLFVFSFVANIFFVLSLKKNYITSTRMITLLDDEMIKKNKRVESFLQRLSKLE